MQFPGSPSEDLPEVLATGASDADFVFLSLSGRDPTGRDADYIAWHSLDHRPEQYRLAGIRNTMRLISTPEARAARELERAGLAVIARNYRSPFGEIDLVMLDGTTLALVEVRSRSTSAHGGAAATPCRSRCASSRQWLRVVKTLSDIDTTKRSSPSEPPRMARGSWSPRAPAPAAGRPARCNPATRMPGSTFGASAACQ